MNGSRLAFALMFVPLAACAAPPTQKISGQVLEWRGFGAITVIVGCKSTASATAASVLADPEVNTSSDSSGNYSLYAAAGKTHNLTAVQITPDSGRISRISLPQPVRAAVVTQGQDDVQGLRIGRSAPVMNAAAASQSPVSSAANAQDNELATAWTTDSAQPLDQQYIALDLGAPTWLAEAVVCWQGTPPSGYRIQTSDDPAVMSGGGTWTDLYVTVSAKSVPLPGAAGRNVSVLVPATAVRARYLRVKVDAYASGQTAASIAEVLAVPAPPITGKVTDPTGNPVQGAAVGGFLDDGPFVYTDADGKYSLPVPMGTSVVGAHTAGCFVSGPRWLDNNTGPLSADFVLFPQGENVLSNLLPSISPGNASSNNAALTDGSLASLWTSGRSAIITSASPTRITYVLNNATISEVDVHWKNFPAAWHLEMTNNITYSNGSSPHASTRTYYTQGETTGAPQETGGYTATDDSNRHVTAIKLAPVYGVTSMSIVITKTNTSDPVSIFEVTANRPRATDLTDAVIALRIARGLQAQPTDPNAFYRWNADNDNTVIDMKDAIALIQDINREFKPLRVLVINYEPYIEQTVTFNNKTYAGVRLREIPKWNNPYTNTEAHRKDLELATHDFLRIHLLPQIDADEYPVFTNGFQFTDLSYLDALSTGTWPAGHCSEATIVSKHDLVRRVGCGDVDEIWCQAVPGMAMWETTMCGPNAYWCNSSPPSGVGGTRLFVMTFFNYERGNDVMLEDWGHRTESILGFKVYGGWSSASERTTFDKFTRYDKITPDKASCGNVHYPPNGIADYDFSNETIVSSDCEDWLNYPNFTGARTMVNRENWAGPHAGDYHRNYHIWWYQHMPHIPGVGPDGKQANWYKYIVDMNAYPESR